MSKKAKMRKKAGIKKEVLIAFFSAMLEGATSTFSNIDTELEEIITGKRAGLYLLRVAVDAIGQVAVSEGIVNDVEERVQNIGASGNAEIVTFANLIVEAILPIYSDFFEYYLSLRGLPPHAYTEERARTNKALAENYLKKSRVDENFRGLFQNIKDTYFSKLKNGEEAFKAYKYFTYRLLEYIYMPLKESGMMGYPPGTFEKDYGLLN